MLNIIQIVTDALFPPRPDANLLRQLTTSTEAALYKPAHYYGVVTLGEYGSPMVRALIHENKYYYNTRAATALASLLQRWLCTQKHPLLLVAIPLSKKRYTERGYNQVTEILAKLPQSPNIVTAKNILTRTRDTASQTSLTRKQRLKNVTNVFTCDPTLLAKYAGYHLIIIDDVATTGATMKAAQTAITPHLPPGATVTCLALAH